MQHVRIASRASRLALLQAQTVARLLRTSGAAVEVVPMTTRGDRDRDHSLLQIGGDGVFVKELERALLEGRADAAVHSFKDVPTEIGEGTCIASVLEREDPRDALASKGAAYRRLADLPPNASVGTSSLRRRALLLAERSDVRPMHLRGNVDTRLRKVMDGEYDAAILALAGLRRLGLEEGNAVALPVDTMTPPAGQGALCVQCRIDDAPMRELLAPLHHRETGLATAIERALLRTLGGGCSVPIGACATVEDGCFVLTVAIAAADGSACMRKRAAGSAKSEVAAVAAAEAVGREMLDAGGRELLRSVNAAAATER